MKKHAKYCRREPCTCDGYHTFDELYDHRNELWVTLCRTLLFCNFDVWKSRKHSDGSSHEGYFVLGVNQEQGTQMTYHLPDAYWDDTEFATILKAAPKFDGHCSEDVLNRMDHILPFKTYN